MKNLNFYGIVKDFFKKHDAEIRGLAGGCLTLGRFVISFAVLHQLVQAFVLECREMTVISSEVFIRLK